ncbi:hypothetical protein LCI18_013840 [Fusarium solani-melongenae]|uniref:Uncharacterized protein n=1 Tax=Fusarium solani subsp. cucurbitae TaxID=2747967 RepID=A0ACD3ZNU7_FUSSC|nr:hypothetical protein LCI18_013840 [Fusarium solani-melongenae]
MSSTAPVAIITGGGLAVAERLVELGWNVAIVDLQAAKEGSAPGLPGNRTLLLQADVSSYDEQAFAFSRVYKTWGRIDFVSVFANAVRNHPPQAETDGWLMQRKNVSKAGSLVMTSSTAGIYAISEVPLYAAAKHGVSASSSPERMNRAKHLLQVLGLARSLGKRMKENGEPITVNAIIPGTVPTAILPQGVIDAIPAQFLTPASLIVKAIEGVLNDSSINGQAIECSGTDIVNRPPHPFVNEACVYTAGGGYREKAGWDAVLNSSMNGQE